MSKAKTVQNQLHQRIIGNIAEIIREIGGEQIAFVILFGSFAKGSWVYDIYEESGAVYEYASDYDFLVITKNQDLRFNHNLKNKIKAEIGRKHLDRVHPATIIIESLAYVNSQIEKSQYFFLDIKKEGKILFDSGKCELAVPREVDKKKRVETAREDYEYWMKNADEFLEICQFCFNKENYKKSAFMLHQAAESLYSCALLVFTGYKPKTHDLEDLGNLCASQNNKFLTVFPRGNNNSQTKSTKHRLTPKSQIELLYNSGNEADWFELLKIAYIEARYSKYYKIKKEQLEYLFRKVEKLREVVVAVCKTHFNVTND